MTPPDLDGLEDFGERAGAALRATETVDAATAAHLAAARARALGAVGQPAPRAWRVAAAGAAAVLVLALALVLAPRPPPAGERAVPDSLELLADDQDLQFYQDLDLYLWLDAEGDHA